VKCQVLVKLHVVHGFAWTAFRFMIPIGPVVLPQLLIFGFFPGIHRLDHRGPLLYPDPESVFHDFDHDTITLPTSTVALRGLDALERLVPDLLDPSNNIDDQSGHANNPCTIGNGHVARACPVDIPNNQPENKERNGRPTDREE
jgi:hypothetical protein